MPLPEQSAALKSSEELIKDLKQLTSDLDKLRNSYEQYFLGLERKEPIKLRESVIKGIRKLSTVFIKNAGHKFQYQQLVSRYNTFTPYWDRVLKEIEEGHYQRDVFRAKLHEQERNDTQKPPPSPVPSKSGKPDPIQQIYDSYLAERKKNGEKGQIQFDKFRTQLQAQMDQLKSKSTQGNLKLQVVTENGKAKIKAVSQQVKKR